MAHARFAARKVDEGSNLSGVELIALMGATLAAALVFLYFVSG